MAKSHAGDIRQFFSNLGDELNGGKVYTYVVNTTTPKATYTDSTGNTARDNPIVLDSAGRASGGIWLNPGEAYKFVLKTSADVTLDTVDNIVAGEASSAADEEIDIVFPFLGTPTAQGTIGIYPVTRSFTLPVNCAGSRGYTITNPGSTYTITLKKDGVECGTVVVSTAGVFTFTTTGGATVAFSAGNTLTAHGPASVGTIADFGFTLIGDIA